MNTMVQNGYVEVKEYAIGEGYDENINS